MLRGQQMILPCDESPEVLEALVQPGRTLCLVSDGADLAVSGNLPHLVFDSDELGVGEDVVGAPLVLDEGYWTRPDAVVLFTSGSTGAPRPQPKSLQQLFLRAQQTATAVLNADLERVVATVPLQHMYGLENGLLLPLVAGLCAVDYRPFYPADIAAVVTSRTLLVSTPDHLRYCVQSNQEFVAGRVLSATAPLSQELAAALEASCSCSLIEIYGSTENGVMATRKTASEAAWTLLQGLGLQREGERCWLVGGGQKQLLSDRIECLNDGRFLLQGRDQDLVKISGKRHSFSALTRLVQSIEGVEDAVVFTENDDYSRLCALVVSSVSVEQVRAGLRRKVDPVFLPRPLLRVERLPRNKVGKLPRSALLAALADARKVLRRGHKEE